MNSSWESEGSPGKVAEELVGADDRLAAMVDFAANNPTVRRLRGPVTLLTTTALAIVCLAPQTTKEEPVYPTRVAVFHNYEEGMHKAGDRGICEVELFAITDAAYAEAKAAYINTDRDPDCPEGSVTLPLRPEVLVDRAAN